MSAATLYLVDHPDDRGNFLPFSDSRPMGELRHGAWLLRERCERALGARVAGYARAAEWLEGYREPEAPPVLAPERNVPRVLLRSTFIPDGAGRLDPAGEAPVSLVDPSGNHVGWVLPAGQPEPGGSGEWPARTIRGRLLAGAWGVVADLSATLTADLEEVRLTRGPARVPAGCTVLGDPDLLMVDEGAAIEPLVVFDLRGGPVWVQQGAEIRSFARLAGPLLVGRGTRVLGGQLRESSIGPRCVVHGEISNCVFLGYSNKAHDGFLGHSLVGRWVNLGAGTVTSNLKNTYGPVRLRTATGRIETGMTFLGSLLGDHVKTAIGTMLPTGCVVGTGANLFGTRRPEAPVPAFAWGTDEPGRTVTCSMFLRVAARVLPRREVAFDEGTRAWLQAVWSHCTGRPCD